MEGKKSFVDELFPRNEVTKPNRYDSLNTILSPRPTGAGNDSAHSEWSGSWKKTGVEGKIQSTSKNDKSVNHYELPESCLMGSSVYYGGRDDFIPQTSATQNSGAHYSYKNKEDDSGNSEVATRGDWWQGSFYY